jgi:hypothetical protein
LTPGYSPDTVQALNKNSQYAALCCPAVVLSGCLSIVNDFVATDGQTCVDDTVIVSPSGLAYQ